MHARKTGMPKQVIPDSYPYFFQLALLAPTSLLIAASCTQRLVSMPRSRSPPLMTPRGVMPIRGACVKRKRDNRGPSASSSCLSLQAVRASWNPLLTQGAMQVAQCKAVARHPSSGRKHQHARNYMLRFHLALGLYLARASPTYCVIPIWVRYRTSSFGRYMPTPRPIRNECLTTTSCAWIGCRLARRKQGAKKVSR